MVSLWHLAKECKMLNDLLIFVVAQWLIVLQKLICDFKLRCM